MTEDTSNKLLQDLLTRCLDLKNRRELDESLALVHIGIEKFPENKELISLYLELDHLRKTQGKAHRFPAGLGDAQTIDGIFGFLSFGDIEALRFAAWNSCGKSINIGVFNGLSSYIIAKTNPGLEVFGIDAYRGMDANNNDINYTQLRLAEENLKKVPNAKLLVGLSSDIASRWQDEIGFLFIDGDHQEAGAVCDLAAWSGFLKRGGFLAVHDAYRKVSQSVARLRKILNGHGPDVICQILENDPNYRFIMVRGCTELWQKIN